MKEMLSELIQYKHLLFMLTWRDIKIKYKQSIMGFMWAIFMPMVVVLAGVIVKKAFAILSGNPMDINQIATVSVKSIPWAFFVGSIRFATVSLTGNTNLVTKIYFPREVFPLSAIIANLFDFCIASFVLIVILTIAGVGISIQLLWVPLLLIILILLTVSMGFFLSCANLFFRDVKYIVEVILNFGIFFTPVFYEAQMFGKWEKVILLNPLGPILESLNSVIVFHQSPNLFWLAYSALWAVIGVLVSWTTFHRAEFSFAENI
ncbi:MAG: lipopolysaccharide transport system permease protein [Candidatus Poribacteria bacterium]|nr:lipopolysaccharide transport system permease protein [Candidatus Poribacteria bacterium]